VHRLLATSLGLFCIVLVGLAWRQRRKGINGPVKLTLVLLAMVILQGMFGRWTVTLNLWPQVVTAHLIGGFTTLSLLWLLTLRLQNRCWQLTPSAFAKIQRLKPLLIVALILVVGQILLGGWTSTNYAALACPDLPTCQGEWWPNMDFSKGFNFSQDIGPNYLGGLMENSARTAIHFSHRIGAMVVTITVSYLIYRLLRIKQANVSQWAMMLAIILIVQISLGLSNVYWSLPLPVAVAHNAVGALLLLTFVGLCHRFYTAKAVKVD
jgi:cytochrome c oxidase assembly protein subunit 15